jgi:hypothetical protein
VSIGQDGTVRSQGVEHFDTPLVNESPTSSSGQKHDPRTVVEAVIPASKRDNSTDGKLVIAEEVAKGHVTWKSMRLYLSGLGGNYPLMFFSIWISAEFLTDWANTFQVWFLGFWGSKYETPSEVNPIP